MPHGDLIEDMINEAFGDGGAGADELTYSRALDYPGLVIGSDGALYVPGSQSALGGPLRAATLTEQQAAFALSFPEDEPARSTAPRVPPTVTDASGQRLQWNPATGRYDIPVGDAAGDVALSPFDEAELQNSADRTQIALDQLNEQIRQNDVTSQQWSDNLLFLQEKFAVETDANRRREALSTEMLMEQVRSRIETNNLTRAGMVQRAQQLQVELQQQAQLANQSATAQAAQINESRRQFNLQQRRGVATDIAEFSRNPGDVGAVAALLMAGGASPFSTAIAEGKTAITPEGLLPLELLLGTQQELAQGPKFFEAQMVNAPFVPIPQFQPQAAPDFSGFFNDAMQQPPLQLTPPAALPERTAPVIDNGTGNVVDGAANIPLAVLAAEEAGTLPEGSAGARALELLRQGITNTTPGAEHGGFFEQAIVVGEAGKELATPVAGGVLIQPLEGKEPKGAKHAQTGGFFADIISQAGSQQTKSPGSEFFGSEDGQDAEGFLNRATKLALARTPFSRIPTPIEASTPGTSFFLQQIMAGLAAIGRGIPQQQFLEEAIGLTPRGVSAQPTRRTA